MKKLLESAFLRIPLTYARLLRIKSNWNLDKYLFLSLVRAGNIVIDGGANIGNYSLLFSRLVRSRGKVFSFEPTPPTYAELKKTLEIGRAKNVRTYPLALGNEQGQATIHLPDGVSGHAALEPHGAAWGNASVKSYAVEVRQLDDWAKEIELDRLDFVKLDLEGAEPLAIEGASETLERHLPSIHLELSPAFMKDFDRSVQGLSEKLVDIGYDVLLSFRDKNDPPALLDDLLQEQADGLDCTLVCLNRKKHAKELSRLT
ncbi:MAG: hypothetical protein CMI31_06420 [Opitutae bacterium]|nr:hypothetical protein [Opitutae bacterium]